MCSASKDAVRMTAGHDEVRGSGPDQVAALDAHDSAWVFPISGFDRLAITSICAQCHLRESSKSKSTGRPWADRVFDLRVDDHPEPLEETQDTLLRLAVPDEVDSLDRFDGHGELSVWPFAPCLSIDEAARHQSGLPVSNTSNDNELSATLCLTGPLSAG